MLGILEQRLKRLACDALGIGMDTFFGQDTQVSRVVTTEGRYVIEWMTNSVLYANKTGDKQNAKRGIRFERQNPPEDVLLYTDILIVEPYGPLERLRGLYTPRLEYTLEFKFVPEDKSTPGKKVLQGSVTIPEDAQISESIDKRISDSVKESLKIRGYERVNKHPVYEKIFEKMAD